MVIVLYFVEDLIEALGTISARLGLIWFIGFRGDLNVKVYAYDAYDGRTYARQVMANAHMTFDQVS